MLLQQTKKLISKVLRKFDLSELFEIRISVTTGYFSCKAELCLKIGSLRRKCTSSRKNECAWRIGNDFAI